MSDLSPRQPSPLEIISRHALRDETLLLQNLLREAALSPADRARISAAAADLVTRIRQSAKPGLMEVFLAEYGLSTDEGIALMCLAEALLRVPDAATMDALIEDKIAPSDWGRHLGKSASSLVNASTWALLLTGRVLDDGEPGMAGHLRAALRRLGEPVIRRAVGQAMKEMGRQFVLGETIEAAMKRAQSREAKGFTYSYDMLGEAARTEADARRYHLSYSRAITAIARACPHDEIRRNPGISIKLSALHPRYEVAKRGRVLAELVPRVRALCGLAKAGGMGLNIDAEEADRLELSLQVIEEVLKDPGLQGWDGFGVVVQAYGRRCGAVIDHLYDLAGRSGRRIMLRLVKGAYWDAEVKRAQVLGLESFPVFTRKQATDVSYIANARKLLGMTDRIYPQFAGHNAHTVAAILDLAKGAGVTPTQYEFQRLHGMGERLHDIVQEDEGTMCRIYAPVGAHRDLLAYLVRRLLENGANSSFVNQIVDEAVPAEVVAACPLTALEATGCTPNPKLAPPPALFGSRRNSRGRDLSDARDLAQIEAARVPHADGLYQAAPLLAADGDAGEAPQEVLSPAFALSSKTVAGRVRNASAADVAVAFDAATPWDAPAEVRAAVLNRAGDLLEAREGEILALLSREAGKTLPDAISELREAVDFLRYYAGEAPALQAPARGIFACISPWNFPLAIFTGQVAAALAAGNAVLAKPAGQTPLIAHLAVTLLHEAGVPRAALQFLPGDGRTVGAALTEDPRVKGVAFTGSTATALGIRKSLSLHAPEAVLIAETGGLNAMIVDSTALPEQAVRDIIASAFQSAGQRCSALRCLYLQEDIAPHVLEMLKGAMAELTLGDPWQLSTDIGPLIDEAAWRSISEYVTEARKAGRVLFEGQAPGTGWHLAPVAIRISSIAEMTREIFGPVLHVVTFKARDLDRVVGEINATGYGLTFGLHSRIDDRVQTITERAKAGNIYVNRNQIGAVVGSQPFGGEGLSGTGPKAGGPMYLKRFVQDAPGIAVAWGGEAPFDPLAALVQMQVPQAALRVHDLPGPTGESNRLSAFARGAVLCLGPGREAVEDQARAVEAAGGVALRATGPVAPEVLSHVSGLAAVVSYGSDIAPLQQALAAREGAIVPLITGRPDASWVLSERHICIDTTASGGNAQLLAEVGA